MKISGFKLSTSTLWQLLACVVCHLPTGLLAVESKPDSRDILRDLHINPSKNDALQVVKTIETEDLQEETPTDSFEVTKLVISGNSVFSTNQLHALIAHLEGTTLTFSELEKGVQDITNLYKTSGYPLTRALIPEQVIEDGIVHIVVLEAVWGNVQIYNSSDVVDSLIERHVMDLAPGKPVKQDTLDQVSLMLSDIPGVDPHFTLQAGQVAGTTDLEILTLATPPVSAEFMMDNQGSKYTGRERKSFNFLWNNPFKQGDVIGINTMSTGELMNYERVSLEFPLARPGLLTGAAVSSLEYSLGDSASSTQSTGTAMQSSIWGKYQIVRSQQNSLATRLQWDHMEMKDHQKAGEIKTDRTINLLNLSVNIDNFTSTFGEARNMLTASWVSGVLGFDDAAAEATDNNSAKHSGKFQKINIQISRQQSISQTQTLVMNLDSQWALNNLDSSQKFSIGGSRSVRAYESGTVSGDGGLLFSAELRQLLPPPPDYLNVKGQWYLSVFADAGFVKINRQPWDNAVNEQSLSGVGWGLNWMGPDNWRASFSMARPLEHTPAAYVSSKRMNAWFEIAKGFR